mmetsp:Transcript_55364/g.98557  ORF Transcript_55364/g.98557 Transcript_55364/m.98557 type:complete len:256 (+) Transcript_55364:832-1599(+)
MLPLSRCCRVVPCTGGSVLALRSALSLKEIIRFRSGPFPATVGTNLHACLGINNQFVLLPVVGPRSHDGVGQFTDSNPVSNVLRGRFADGIHTEDFHFVGLLCSLLLQPQLLLLLQLLKLLLNIRIDPVCNIFPVHDLRDLVILPLIIRQIPFRSHVNVFQCIHVLHIKGHFNVLFVHLQLLPVLIVHPCAFFLCLYHGLGDKRLTNLVISLDGLCNIKPVLDIFILLVTHLEIHSMVQQQFTSSLLQARYTFVH